MHPGETVTFISSLKYFLFINIYFVSLKVIHLRFNTDVLDLFTIEPPLLCKWTWTVFISYSWQLSITSYFFLVLVKFDEYGYKSIFKMQLLIKHSILQELLPFWANLNICYLTTLKNRGWKRRYLDQKSAASHYKHRAFEKIALHIFSATSPSLIRRFFLAIFSIY